MAPSGADERPAGSAIVYLLLEHERSAPHRIDATELWHFYAGDPLELRCEWPDGRTDLHVMGPDVARGQEPQVVVPAGIWQSARPLGAYALMGSTVCPAFTFEGFELRDRAARDPIAAGLPLDPSAEPRSDPVRGQVGAGHPFPCVSSRVSGAPHKGIQHTGSK